MKRSIVTWLLVLLTSSGTYAQMRQMVWPLPMALDFNSNPATAWTDNTVPKLLLSFHSDPPTLIEEAPDLLWRAKEPISSICNRWGQLQLYSDNHRIWNASHQLVENINSIHSWIPEGSGVWSTVANGTMILPYPGDSLDRYFALWNMDHQINYGPLTLQYSVVDRYGGTTGTGILLHQGLPERPLGNTTIQEGLTAIKHANGRDWWIICRKGMWNSDTIISMLFTPRGIEAVNYFTAPNSYGIVVNMRASNDGTLLSETVLESHDVNLYKFNRCSGELFYRSTLHSDGLYPYGMAFAPGGKMLYVASGSIPPRLFQLIIKEDTIYSATRIFYSSGLKAITQLSLGPDGRIYCVHKRSENVYNNPELDTFSHHLGVIQYPDEEGMACQYNPHGIHLNGHIFFGIGLPNHPNYDLGPLRGSICDSLPDPVIASVPAQVPAPGFAVTLYPNPAADVLMIRSAGGMLSELSIYNSLGRLVWRSDAATLHQPIAVGEWPVGLYTAVARSREGDWSTQQLVIQR
jgi:hypothetical protein